MKIDFRIGWTSIGLPVIYGISMGSVEESMIGYFKDRSYGKGCKQITFQQYCVDKKIFYGFNDYAEYNSKSKRIYCSVELDYKTSFHLTYQREFFAYIKNRFMDKANDFYEFNIKDFDLNQFINDLDSFFTSFLERQKNNETELVLTENDYKA